ncbi:MAG TPA: sulfite exporter TauE/SafE family protein, partial [Gaiellales bacterium]|nr:sulfite exporter TauE/SafE family protein [Gaiellales bacterium]
PTLIFLGLTSHQAVATSLAAMVPVILAGAWRQTRYGLVDWRAAVVIGLASVPTAKLGEVAAGSLSNATLRRLFALVMLAAAVQLAVRALRQPPSAQEPPDAGHGTERSSATPTEPS